MGQDRNSLNLIKSDINYEITMWHVYTNLGFVLYKEYNAVRVSPVWSKFLAGFSIASAENLFPSTNTNKNEQVFEWVWEYVFHPL